MKSFFCVVRAGLKLLLAGTAWAALPIQAEQGFPTRPITLVVAYGAGGTTDIMARALAQSMSTVLGQPVVVENKSGAGGVIGTSFVAAARPDGYTLGFGTSSQLVMNAGIYKLGFDVDKDLQMVGLVAKFPLVLYAANSVPHPLSKFVKVAIAEPGRFKYGSGGNGQIGHISAAMFMKQTGIDAMHVPYRAAAQVLPDIMGGRIDLFMDTLVSGSALAKEGKLRILAVGGNKRSASAPDVPTFREQGITTFDPYSWTSVFAPATLPPDVVVKLNDAINAAVKSDFFKQKIQQQGGEALAPSTPAAATAFADRERSTWVPFIRASGIKSD